MRHAFVLAAAAVGLLAMPSVSPAQTFPSRTVSIVVPYAAGGGLDTTARLVAAAMTKDLGQQIVVENRPGANGQVGVASVAAAQPDGYTLLIVNASPMTMTPHLAKVTYDPQKDFAPVSTIITNDLMIAVNASFPAKNFKEFAELIKANPGKYSFSSAGLGGESHLAMELVMQATGMKIKHVPFAGDGAAMPSVLNGDVPIMLTAFNSIQSYVKAGTIRPIVLLGAKRIPAMPDTPTIVEEGQPTLVVGTWFGLYAPKGTPADVVARLNKAVGVALAEATVMTRIGELGMTLAPSTPDGLATKLRDENVRWEKVIKDANIKIN